MVKQRKKEQANKRQQQHLTQEEIQEQQQLLQSKIRQEIQQMKSKLAINKRPKAGKGNVKGNSPSKMKAKNKDGGFFRKHLEEKIRMQNVPVDAEYDTCEDDEDEEDDEYEENSATSSKKHVRSSLNTYRLHHMNDIPFTSVVQAPVGGYNSPEGCWADGVQESGEGDTTSDGDRSDSHSHW